MSTYRNPRHLLSMLMVVCGILAISSQSSIAGGSARVSDPGGECSIYGKWQSISRSNYDATVWISRDHLIENDDEPRVPLQGMQLSKYADLSKDHVGYYGFPEGEAPYPFFAVVVVERHRHWGCVLRFEGYRNATDGQIDPASYAGSMSYIRN